MVKLEVDLRNYKEFAKDFEASQGTYEAILRGSFGLAVAGMILAFESHPVVGLGIFISCIIIEKLLFMRKYYKREDEYKGVSKLLDTLDEDVLTTNNTIVKGLDYSVSRGSSNRLSDSYADDKYVLTLEVCDED